MALGATTFVEDHIFLATWGVTLSTISFALSIAVNALVTGLIVFKILKVFLRVRATSTSVERSLGSTGGSKLRYIIFVIIESGMALFAIQLIRLVLYAVTSVDQKYLNFVIGVNQMFNVIIRSFHFYFFFTLLITFTWLGHHTNNNFGAGLNEIVI